MAIDANDIERTREEIARRIDMAPDAAVFVAVDRAGAVENHAVLDYDRDGIDARERTRVRVIERLMDKWPAAAAEALARRGGQQ
jgi:hypothetical protein